MHVGGQPLPLAGHHLRRGRTRGTPARELAYEKRVAAGDVAHPFHEVGGPCRHGNTECVDLGADEKPDLVIPESAQRKPLDSVRGVQEGEEHLIRCCRLVLPRRDHHRQGEVRVVVNQVHQHRNGLGVRPVQVVEEQDEVRLCSDNPEPSGQSLHLTHPHQGRVDLAIPRTPPALHTICQLRHQTGESHTDLAQPADESLEVPVLTVGTQHLRPRRVSLVEVLHAPYPQDTCSLGTRAGQELRGQARLTDPCLARDGDDLQAAANGAADAFRHDTATGRTIRVSVRTDGQQNTYGSRLPAISGNGMHVLFESHAKNLTPVGTSGWGNVFVRSIDGAYPALHARVGKLPARMPRKKKGKVPTFGIAAGQQLRVVWKQGKRKTNQNVRVKSNSITLKAPNRRGRYKVTISYAGQVLRTRAVAVR